MSAARKSAPVRNLEREAEAAKALRSSLATVLGDDTEAIRDAIEGETGLHEAIAEVLAMVTEAEVLEAGLKHKIGQFQERKTALEKRIDSLRAIIGQAMVIGEIKTLPLAEATLSIADTAPRAIVIDEAQIPARFWKPQDPTLDKRALNEAVKAGEEIPGVTRSNGSVSLKVRRA